ncbi:MAG: isomerase [Rhodobacteraceae bacterium]|nr:isomerase [Paracoccaceae bacterium]
MSRLQFSANLGFLWTELPIDHAIQRAVGAGFHGIEMHWPDPADISKIKSALTSTHLPLLSLNTVPGTKQNGDFGLCAMPDRRGEAKAAIDLAVDQADVLNAKFIHVMAGKASGPDAHGTFVENLEHALYITQGLGVPEYFLKTVDQAIDIINEIGSPDLKLMFDFYHVERQQGSAITRFQAALNFVGHVQFASVPDRGPPDDGDLDFDNVFKVLDAHWNGFCGAEYRPDGPADTSLQWLQNLNSDRDTASEQE